MTLSLSEWDELPYLLQQAIGFVRLWTRQLEAEAMGRSRAHSANAARR